MGGIPNGLVICKLNFASRTSFTRTLKVMLHFLCTYEYTYEYTVILCYAYIYIQYVCIMVIVITSGDSHFPFHRARWRAWENTWMYKERHLWYKERLRIKMLNSEYTIWSYFETTHSGLRLIFYACYTISCTLPHHIHKGEFWAPFTCKWMNACPYFPLQLRFIKRLFIGQPMAHAFTL